MNIVILLITKLIKEEALQKEKQIKLLNARNKIIIEFITLKYDTKF